MKQYAGLLALTVMLHSLTASAFVKSQTGVKIAPQKELQSARELRFQVGLNETQVKNELEILKKRNKQLFQAELKDKTANTSELQSYLYEVRDGRSKVERAKLIAKAQLYKAVQKNWKDLRNTILNEMGAANWKEFDPFFRDQLQNLSYLGLKKEGKTTVGLEFHIGEWGRVTVYEKKGSFEKVDWTIAIRSPHDSNTLPPNYEDIRIQGEEGEE